MHWQSWTKPSVWVVIHEIKSLWVDSIWRCSCTSLGIPIIMIRWSHNHLIFVLEISVPRKMVSLLSMSLLCSTYIMVISWSLYNSLGGGVKNTYELLNLRALKILILYKNHIFQCMGRIFCVEFQRVPPGPCILVSNSLWPGPLLNIKTVYSGIGSLMLKIRRSWDRLSFNMGIRILVRRHLYIETPLGDAVWHHEI